jgi:hypothetical protein
MSPARLQELKDQVAAVRLRLEGWAQRLAELRAGAAGSAEQGTAGTAATVISAPPAPLFHGLGLGDGALDDVELHFEVLDTEDPGRSR